MSEKNPTREIFFFRNTVSNFGYIYMSLKAGKDEFFELFENAEEVTQDEFDKLVAEDPEFKVVFVGDDSVIDKYFSDVAPAKLQSAVKPHRNN